MREYHFRNILILSPSASRIILGVSSALKCAGVEVLALGADLGFFLCLHTQGGQEFITFNSPLEELQGEISLSFTAVQQPHVVYSESAKILKAGLETPLLLLFPQALCPSDD